MPTWYHRATWTVLRSLYAPWLRMRQRVEAKGLAALPEPPFVLMSDHAHSLDAYVIGSFSKAPVRFMANIEGVAPWKALAAELVGAYPRRKGSADLAALRRTIALAASGEAIGIFPEGDRSWDGSAQALRPGSARLLKRLGVPLVLARQLGNYLAKPRWADRPRRGPWSVDFSVFDADEIGRMSEGLVDAIIASALAKNEVKDALREGRIFEGEGLAEGIERLLWRCPSCGSSDRLGGSGDEIGCRRCGARWRVDANQRVMPASAAALRGPGTILDLKDWHDWQVATLPELMAGSRGRPGLVAAGVELARKSDRGWKDDAAGRLSLVDGNLVFTQPAGRRIFEAAAVRGFVDNFNAFCEFSYRGERWRIDFRGGNALKWIRALESLNARPLAARGAADDGAGEAA